MNKALLLLGVGAMVGVATIVQAYEDAISEGGITKEDLDMDLKSIQAELSRLHSLKESNDRFELTGQVQKVELLINGVEINEKINELTERIAAAMEVQRNRNKS